MLLLIDLALVIRHLVGTLSSLELKLNSLFLSSLESTLSLYSVDTHKASHQGFTSSAIHIHMASPSPFAVVFLGHAYPVPSSAFQQISMTNWVLDIITSVTPNYQTLKDCCLMLTAPGLLNDDMALGLYVKCGTYPSSEWLYRGMISNFKPSDCFALQWAELHEAARSGAVQIGVSVEPRAQLEGKEQVRVGSRADFAKRVAFDLLRFVGSFGHVLPVELVERWYDKFQRKYELDPNFLTRNKDSF